MQQRHQDGPEPVATKRALLHVTRVLEEVVALEAGRHGGTVSTLALFEDAAYFAHERARYGRLARLGPVIAGFVGPPPDEVPAGVALLPLAPDEPLADEWTVIVLSAHGQGALIAHDLHTAIEATTLERGRLFSYTVTTDVPRVAEAATRLLDAAHGRIDPCVEAAVRDAVAALPHAGGCPGAHVLGRATEAALDRVLRLSADLQEAERRAEADPLTGAANRRAMTRFLSQAGARSPQLGVLAFDLDDFKAANDRYGHAAGDVILRRFADLVREHSRATDLLVRLGGDEFVLLCPGLDADQARQRAARIVAGVAALRFAPPAAAARVRCSAGSACFPAHAVDLDVVDAALYAAKQAGGGVVRDAGEAGGSAAVAPAHQPA